MMLCELTQYSLCRLGDLVKLLYWDSDGLVIWYNQLKEHLPDRNAKDSRIDYVPRLKKNEGH